MQNVVTPARGALHGQRSRRPPLRALRLRTLLLHVAALVLLPAMAHAQSFGGSSPRATPLFRLGEGLTVFEMTHRGAGEFIVRLLDSDGREVSELARASGPYEGSRALRIERAGEYLLDVDARGEWTVALRGAASGAAAAQPAPRAAPPTLPPPSAPDSAELAAGMEAGRVAAGGLSGRWFLGGLLGGSVAGPLGLGAAVHFAGRGGTALPTPPRSDPRFAEGFRQGFESRARLNRRKAAFVGGMIGTAVFTTVIIQLMDISGKGGANTDPGGGPGPLRVAR